METACKECVYGKLLNYEELKQNESLPDLSSFNCKFCSSKHYRPKGSDELVQNLFVNKIVKDILTKDVFIHCDTHSE